MGGALHRIGPDSAPAQCPQGRRQPGSPPPSYPTSRSPSACLATETAGAPKCTQGPAGEGGWPGPDRPRTCWTVRGHRTRQWEGACAGSDGPTRPWEAGYAPRSDDVFPVPRWCLDTRGLSRRRRSAAGARPERRPGRPGAAGRDGVDRARYCSPRAGPRVGLALVGPERHRPLGLGGDRQRRVDAEVGRDRRAVGDVQAGVAEDPLVGVDDAGLGRVADGAAADEVGGQRHVERLADVAAGGAADRSRRSGVRRRWRPGSRSGSGAPWPCREVIRHGR